MSIRSLSTALIVSLTLIATAEPRTRAVKHPCASPTVTLTSSSSSVCPRDNVVLTWIASDRTALVSVDGVGTNLPPSGTASVPVPQATTFHATARNACGGTSSTASVSIAMRSDPTGSLSTPATATQGSTINVFITAANSATWSLSSSLGNGINPASGSGNGSFSASYFATRAGTDTLQLSLSGQCAGSALPASFTRAITIGATTPAPVPQPVGFLRCCDGTLSPTCTSCANKQGCCSHHGGVCGC